MVDADDRLTLDALDTLRPPLEADPDVGYCYGLMRLIGAWSGVLALPRLRPLHPLAPLDRRRHARPRPTGVLGGRRRFRSGDRRLRGLGLLSERARARLARIADPAGHSRVPQARAVGTGGTPPPLPARLPPAPGEARRPFRPSQGVRRADRPRAAASVRRPQSPPVLRGVCACPSASRWRRSSRGSRPSAAAPRPACRAPRQRPSSGKRCWSRGAPRHAFSPRPARPPPSRSSRPRYARTQRSSSPT